jgi:hypothetical protein
LYPSDLSRRQFYLGVDGSPGHVTAHLDVLRPHEMRQIVEAAGEERYALVVGPSGSGKSVLLWRAARDAVLGARVVRVRRLETPEHADLLVRHVRLLEPTKISPVVVAADNLGRPRMAAWPTAVDALRELPAVVVIAACRAEDFHPALVRGGARIVEPRLDELSVPLRNTCSEGVPRPLPPRATPIRLCPSHCATYAANVAPMPRPSSRRASAGTGALWGAESSITIKPSARPCGAA